MSFSHYTTAIDAFLRNTLAISELIPRICSETGSQYASSQVIECILMIMSYLLPRHNVLETYGLMSVWQWG